jgi:hypothetical protein
MPAASAPYPFAPGFTDPFSEVQAAIENVIRNNPDLAKLISIGNEEADGEDKHLIKDADAPGWHIRPWAGGGAQLRKTSSATMLVQNYAIGLVSLDKDIKVSYFPLKFQVIRAFELAMQNSGGNLGLSYVTGFQFADILDQDATNGANVNADLQRGMEGWVGIVVISVTMLINNVAMRVATLKVSQPNG